MISIILMIHYRNRNNIMKKYFVYVILIIIVLPNSTWANNFSKKNLTYNRLGGDSVEVVGLKYNIRLNKLIIPNTIKYNDSIFRVVSLKEECFEYKRIKKVFLPEGIKKIPFGAFDNCISLKEVYIPNSVSTIEDYAFENTKLKHVKLPLNLESIGMATFYDCKQLKNIDFPDNLKKIEADAFHGCESLKFIDLSKVDITIGDCAFYGCKSLNDVNISDNSIFGTDVFGFCFGIKKPIYTSSTFVYLPIESEGDFIVPEGIKTISGGAFNGCYLITSIILPQSLLKIEEYAFACCLSLQSLIINSHVKFIGRCAINNCPSLCKIICYAETPPHTEMLYDQNNFFQIESIFSRPKNIILYIPSNSIEQYKQANGWSSFGEFKTIDSIK